MHQNKTTERLGEPTLPQRQAKLEWKHFSNLYILFSQEAIYIYIFFFLGGGWEGGGVGRGRITVSHFLDSRFVMTALCGCITTLQTGRCFHEAQR